MIYYFILLNLLLSLSTSEMFGQVMTTLGQLELVLKMSSCVYVISSKWIFPLVSDRRGISWIVNVPAFIFIFKDVAVEKIK